MHTYYGLFFAVAMATGSFPFALGALQSITYNIVAVCSSEDITTS
jgi:hypothetical protein